MSIQHSAIATADSHEPKGVSSATTATVATANGGAVSWDFPTESIGLDIVNLVTDASYFITVPWGCTITTFSTVIDNAFTTADCSVLLNINAIAVTDGAITITQSGSAAGDIDSVSPSALNIVPAGGVIEVVVSGTNATATRCHVLLVLTRTA